MCCEPRNNLSYDDQNGECPDCGSPTVNGDAIDACVYSAIECETCGSSPCDGSC